MTPKRKISPTGIYHITMRGINKQNIFETKEDFEKFLEILRKYESICDFKLLGYCLMNNHVHLIIKVGSMPLGRIFQHISPSYVYYFNNKYKRVGSLFQSPFKSRPILTDNQLLIVLRYVHQNPVKAGICKEPKDYQYSSFNNYFANDLIDASFVQAIIDKKEFFEFNCAPNNDHCMDIEDEKPRLNDDDAKEIMYKICACRNVTQFQALKPPKRDSALRDMWKAGISMAQANRITGISLGIIKKAITLSKNS